MNEEKLENNTAETMDDYKEELERSFQTFQTGDLCEGTILDITDNGIFLDIHSFTDGWIPADEISNNPTVSPADFYKIGDLISAVVLSAENEAGYVELSLRDATDKLAWDVLRQGKEDKTVYTVSIAETVPSGLVTYLKDIRGFIPISQISTSHIEDTSSYKNAQLDVQIITAEQAQNKLILSAKSVLLQKAVEQTAKKTASLQNGQITSGIVDKIVPYGAFVKLDDNLSGLVHISEICNRRLQSPKEVLHEGDTVNVKILNITDGKISLSIKQAEYALPTDAASDEAETTFATEYTSDESASTSLASLLSNLDLH